MNPQGGTQDGEGVRDQDSATIATYAPPSTAPGTGPLHSNAAQTAGTSAISAQSAQSPAGHHSADTADYAETPAVSNITPAADTSDSDPDEDVDLFGDPLPPTPRTDGKCDDCGNPLHKGRCVRCEVEGRRSA